MAGLSSFMNGNILAFKNLLRLCVLQPGIVLNQYLIFTILLATTTPWDRIWSVWSSYWCLKFTNRDLQFSRLAKRMWIQICRKLNISTRRMDGIKIPDGRELWWTYCTAKWGEKGQTESSLSQASLIHCAQCGRKKDGQSHRHSRCKIWNVLFSFPVKLKTFPAGLQGSLCMACLSLEVQVFVKKLFFSCSFSGVS